MAYAEQTRDHDCAHVFVATSNHPQPLLLDQALARRFIHVNIDGRMSETEEGLLRTLRRWCNANRDQVWAEAVHRLGGWDPDGDEPDPAFAPEKVYQDDTMAQMNIDPEFDELLTHLEKSHQVRWTVKDMMQQGEWLAKDKPWSDEKFRKVADARGWTSKRPQEGGVRISYWYPPNDRTGNSQQPQPEPPPTGATMAHSDPKCQPCQPSPLKHRSNHIFRNVVQIGLKGIGLAGLALQNC